MYPCTRTLTHTFAWVAFLSVVITAVVTESLLLHRGIAPWIQEGQKVNRNPAFYETKSNLEPVALRLLAQRCQVSEPCERPSFLEISHIITVNVSNHSGIILCVNTVVNLHKNLMIRS